MKRYKFLADIKNLKQEDFDFTSAYTNRETGSHKFDSTLAKLPLPNVLKTHKVCILGYLYSLLQAEDFENLAVHYGFSEDQLSSLTFPSCITFLEDGKVITAPRSSATLEEVVAHIKHLMAIDDWVDGRFSIEESFEEYNT